MQNYHDFHVGEKTARAYTTLANIYHIESSGVNLAQKFYDIANGKYLSFAEASKILDEAIKTDMSDIKIRSQFVNDFFNAKRFRAVDEVAAFVLNLLATPNTNEGDVETEKK